MNFKSFNFFLQGAKKPDPKGGAKGGKTAAKPKKDGAGGKAKKKVAYSFCFQV